MSKYNDSLKFFMSKGFHDLSWRNYSNLRMGANNVEEYKKKILDSALINDKKLFDLIVNDMSDRCIVDYFSKHFSVRELILRKGRREVIKKLKKTQ